MKKTSVLFLIAIMAIGLAGCTGKKSEQINYSLDLEGKVIGLVTPWEPAEVAESLIIRVIGAEQKEVKYFNRQSDITTALIAGKIDGAPVLKIVADYSVKRNEKLKIVEANQIMICSIIMFLRSEEKTFKYELDSAITILQDNGVIKQLEDKWITNLPATDEPSNKEMPKIEGARTVYVGVSGDVTPLDYIAADGKPAGYNVALLTEIGKLLNINFELVSIETQAKITALGSKKIDLIFCQININDQVNSKAGDKFIGTKPYFVDEGMCFLVRK